MSNVQETESKIITFKIGSFVQMIIFIIAIVFSFGGIVARGEYNRANLEEKQQSNKSEIGTVKADVKVIENDLNEHKHKNELEMQQYSINQTLILETLLELKEDIKEIKKAK